MVSLLSVHAALPQLDRGSDYESERHRFESYTPHHEFSAGLVPAFLLSFIRTPNNIISKFSEIGVAQIRLIHLIKQVYEFRFLLLHFL